MSKQKTIDVKNNTDLILTKLFINNENRYYYNLIFSNNSQYEKLGQVWQGRVLMMFNMLIDVIREKKTNELLLSDFEKYLLPKENRLENIINEFEKTKSAKNKESIYSFLKNIPDFQENNEKQNERTYEIYNWFADSLYNILSSEKIISNKEDEKCFNLFKLNKI